MNTDFVFIEFSTISCLSLINSCCCSVLAKAPPAHNHKYNPSQPCQELYYSCGPNTRPENGMSTLQATVPCLPWLCNPQETAPERQIPYGVCIVQKKANKQNKKKKQFPVSKCCGRIVKESYLKTWKSGILSPPGIMWQSYLHHAGKTSPPESSKSWLQWILHQEYTW